VPQRHPRPRGRHLLGTALKTRPVTSRRNGVACAQAVEDLLERGQIVSEAGMAAIERAEAAGMVLGPEVFFGTISVRRHPGDIRRVWLDVGDIVSVLGVSSDEDDSLFIALVELLAGREAVERFQQALENDTCDFRPFSLRL
jgi:hypothetical protein